MMHRLACVDIPSPGLQILLQQKPEWKDDAVVLLDRDEANGRIVDLNAAALELGLGRGMLYGPALGIHRELKGAVLSSDILESRQKAILDCLLNFSPHVEHSWFQDGTYWLDANGLSYVFSGVRQWLSLIHSAVEKLGFDCALAAGSSRFATYAAGRLKPSGIFNIFRDEAAERLWLNNVPVHLVPMNNQAMQLFKRLKILTMGDVLQLPIQDISRRFSADAAKMVSFIRNERYVPLQYLEPEAVMEWEIKPEEALSRAEDLHQMGCLLIDRCLSQAEKRGLRIQCINFRFAGASFAHEASVSPVYPTRNRETLVRLLKLRIEYLVFDNPVHEIQCRLILTEERAPQMNLFETAHHRQRSAAAATIRSLQAQRGQKSVQFAELVGGTLSTRNYRLCAWQGFPSRRLPSAAPVKTRRRLSRRVVLSPCSLGFRPGNMVRVVYSGGWWERPYHYEMSYARISGRWHWLQKQASHSWELVGWVD